MNEEEEDVVEEEKASMAKRRASRAPVQSQRGRYDCEDARTR